MDICEIYVNSSVHFSLTKMNFFAVSSGHNIDIFKISDVHEIEAFPQRFQSNKDQ